VISFNCSSTSDAPGSTLEEKKIKIIKAKQVWLMSRFNSSLPY